MQRLASHEGFESAAGRTADPSTTLRSPGIPVETRGTDALHAVFFKGKPHTWPLPAARGRNSGSGRDDKGRGVAQVGIPDGRTSFFSRGQRLFLALSKTNLDKNGRKWPRTRVLGGFHSFLARHNAFRPSEAKRRDLRIKCLTVEARIQTLPRSQLLSRARARLQTDVPQSAPQSANPLPTSPLAQPPPVHRAN